ncbi:MAG: hypothetical protein ACLFUW_10490 [Bacteroidales bacterium]
MLGIFKRKKKQQLRDYDGNPLKVGDRVHSLRYELGECILVDGEKGIEYESIQNGKRVSYVWMIDAHTENQKVRKIFDEEK